MIQRLIDFYNRYCADAEDTMSYIWLGVAKHHHAKLVGALTSNDPKRVKLVLDSLAPAYGVWGIERPSALSGDELAVQLGNLARRIGILALPNPEQPVETVLNVNELKSQIESALRFKLSLPDCFGFQTEGGKLPVKILHYGAIAFTIQQLFPKTSPANILELGAGLGQLGYIVWHGKTRSYTVLDLPTVAVMSSYFLSGVFGSHNTWLAGEPEPKGFARFYPSTDYAGVSAGKYDLIVSVDGFPELPIPVQDKYLNLIDECLTPNGFFLSMNHESNDGGQRRVFDAVRKHGKLRLIARYPFMMRAGYIEEIYQH